MCVCALLHAVCPVRNLPGTRARRPLVPGSAGDMASVCPDNLQASSERSRGANDRLETVTMATDTIPLQHSLPWNYPRIVGKAPLISELLSQITVTKKKDYQAQVCIVVTLGLC